MKTWLSIISLFLSLINNAQDNIVVVDNETKEGIAFVTVSFGNGNGTFADGDGVFKFSKVLYKDVDSLFISSIGYQELALSSSKITDTLFLKAKQNNLETVIINAQLTGKHKRKKKKELAHDNYHDCWLPTVESEIAVRFDRYDNAPTQIKTLKLPILLEDTQRSKNRKQTRRFSTMFRVVFYDVSPDGKPVRESLWPSKTFIITQEAGDVYELDIEELNINIPQEGIFASIQVLGYTTPKGELIKAKKYREFKSKYGTQKIATTYRPLLPFTDEIEGKKTYVRRIFLNNKQWTLFDFSYNPKSKLLRSGHENYGMGAEFKVFYKD